jgi:hypothetical protein
MSIKLIVPWTLRTATLPAIADLAMEERFPRATVAKTVVLKLKHRNAMIHGHGQHLELIPAGRDP